MSNTKSVLGKGLASLLPGAGIPQRPPQFATTGAAPGQGPTAQPSKTAPAGSLERAPAGATAAGSAMPVTSATDRIPGVTMAFVGDIAANDYQPRKGFDDATLAELADSIRINGIIQPLVVRRGSQGYQLIAGERRLRAAKLAGLKQVPVVIRKSTDKEALEIALIENIQREDLNCIDTAQAYHQLIEEFSLTQEEAAKRVGKDRASVANHLRLLRLPEALIDDLKRQIISFGHGKAILGVDDKDTQLRIRAQIVEKKLSVRETEALVDQAKRSAASPIQHDPSSVESTAQATTTPLQSRLNTIEQDLTRQLSTKVEIKGNDKRGKIVVHYSTRQDLERILEAMGKAGQN